ncbi:FecR domain-containing protein [Parasphingorhabdus flavimaris]|uniref:FecR domain-containing protein n=1 Tax=Parasphingorhabdus flavimaris TaxID=266812 RepID=A0ABX2N3Y9_9SPHN|nr:FecR domain-containing protein [Parasphingorhabdus flavimaris]
MFGDVRNFIPPSGLRIFATFLIFALACAPQQSAAQKSRDSEQISYIFKRGDTLFDLATKYLRKRSDYLAVQRINRIANPRQIPMGKSLLIPVYLLKYRPSEASLSAFRGDVSIAAGGQNLTPVQGLDLEEGSRITTAARSFLTLQLEDGSRVSIPSNSNVRITRLRHILLTDSVDYEIAVDMGRLRSKVAPLQKKADRYRVRTPVAVSAVRGTDYRTRVDEISGTAFSETVEGEVVVAAGESLNSGNLVAIPAGTGAAATATGALAKAELLPPPELLDPAKVQSDAALQFAVEPRASAIGHRIMIASDAGFVDIVAEGQEMGAVIELPAIPNGRYFAKVTALAADGFEGMPATYSFKRQLSTLGGSADAGDFGYRFKWFGEGEGQRFYRLQIVKDSKTAIPIIDEAALSTNTVTLSELADGEYYWRVGVIQFSTDPEDNEAIEKWTDFEKLTVAN